MNTTNMLACSLCKKNKSTVSNEYLIALTDDISNLMEVQSSIRDQEETLTLLMSLSESNHKVSRY